MSRLRVAVIVEGHGEMAAAPILLRRLWSLVGGQFIDVLKPIRSKRNLLEKELELRRVIALAIAKLKNDPLATDPALILILFDRDPSPELPCEIAPRVLAIARAAFSHADIGCVLANIEYETWFVAAAESLDSYIRLRPGEVVPDHPEDQRCGKHWIESRFSGTKYSETQDQPAMTATMDLAVARGRAPSFDKLWREFEQRATTSPS